MKPGDRVRILTTDISGVLTRVTKRKVGWVRVRSRWGNHHHPVTPKTFRRPMEDIVREEDEP